MMNETKLCAACQEEKTRDDFTLKQWKKGRLGRCHLCIFDRVQVPAYVHRQVLQERMDAEAQRELERQEHIRQLDRDIEEYDKKQQERFQFRLIHPAAPPHPDEGNYQKFNWKPNQSVQIKPNGGFCFGLRHEVQNAAKQPLMSQQQAAFMTCDQQHGPVTPNSVAKAGTWNAYKLTTRRENGMGNFTAGWIICHEDLDPVCEIRQMIFNTIGPDFGGDGFHSDMGTKDHHQKLGFALFPRYIIGTIYQFSERKGQNLLNEGIYFVDYWDARRGNPKTIRNAIKGMHSGGEFDIARLSYDETGVCKAFLLVGNYVCFQETYFEKGTAPLGQMEWEPDVCYCPLHETGVSKDRTVTVDEYVKRSKTKIVAYTEPKKYVLVGKKKKRTHLLTVQDDCSSKDKENSVPPTTCEQKQKQLKITSFFQK